MTVIHVIFSDQWLDLPSGSPTLLEFIFRSSHLPYIINSSNVIQEMELWNFSLFNCLYPSVTWIFFFLFFIQTSFILTGCRCWRLSLHFITLNDTHTHTHTHSVGLLWTRDRPVTETSTRQHTTLTRDRHPCPWRVRNHNHSKRAATDPRLRPRGHRVWLFPSISLKYSP